jgi:predicted small secreted protein
MTIFRATMTALALVCFTAATVPAAGQDVRRAGKTAHHSTHAKKRAQASPQAKPAGSRESEQWMNRGSESGAGVGGGGGY